MAAVIECRNLGKVYKPTLGKAAVRGLEGLNMSVEESEIFGFLGPNGAGKTTTIKILTSLHHATEGDAKLFGKPVTDPDAKRRIGFLPEQPYFYDHLTGRELLHYFGRIFGLRGEELSRRVERLLERVRLGHAGDQLIRGYSKGMQQRIGLAQALINDPPLVILDEPMSGLDPIGRKEVRDLILELRHERRTVFFSTHILSDVEVVCDRVAILDKGKLVTLAPLGQLVELAGDRMEIVLAGLDDEGQRALALLCDGPIANSGGRIIARAMQDKTGAIVDLARARKASILSLSPIRRSLEEIFMAKITHPGGAT